MLANQERIGVSDADLKAGKLNNNQPEFAIADASRISSGDQNEARTLRTTCQHGRRWRRRIRRSNPDGPLVQAAGEPEPQTWTAFYNALGAANGQPIADRHRGALPFRVAEIYAQMVQFVAAKDVTEFVRGRSACPLCRGRLSAIHVCIFTMVGLGIRRNQTCIQVRGHRCRSTQGRIRRRRQQAPRADDGRDQDVQGSAAAAHATVELMKKTMVLIDPPR